MTSKKMLSACAAMMLLVASSYTAFWIGQVKARRENLRDLAVVSLMSIEPAVRLIEFETENSGQVPMSLVLSAEKSIAVLAQVSMVFDPNPESIPRDQRNILCVIAKNRDRHLAFHAPSSPYGDDLMAHLEKIYRETAKEAANNSGIANGRVPCSLSATQGG